MIFDEKQYQQLKAATMQHLENRGLNFVIEILKNNIILEHFVDEIFSLNKNRILFKTKDDYIDVRIRLIREPHINYRIVYSKLISYMINNDYMDLSPLQVIKMNLKERFLSKLNLKPELMN